MDGRIRAHDPGAERALIRTLATAGHVDHGKSTLVEALTGTHPDRLKEEREREMSIDLGYAYLTLPNGVEVGIVDVPGHRDFIANMLAGVGGVDAVLLVVAADEGVMPQTREHVAILDLLGVSHGLVALTKIDLAPDPEWLDLVEEEVRALLRPTTLREAPVVRVSVRTGQGLEEVRAMLARVLEQVPPRPDRGRPRLPVDRAFTLRGFGTIVTGTLTDGALHVGQEVEILPRGLQARVRSIQSHKKARERALPGARTALNLAGVKKTQVERGHVVVLPGTYAATRRLDVHLRVLPDAPTSIRHNQWLKLFLWTSEVLARVRLLGQDQLLPGEQGFAQLELRESVVAAYGDRFILRRPSPEATLAGGRVLDPHPTGRHRRFRKEVLERMEALHRGTPETVVAQYLQHRGWLSEADVEALPVSAEQARKVLDAWVRSGRVRVLEVPSGRVWVSHAAWDVWWERVRRFLEEWHWDRPAEVGVSVGVLGRMLGLDGEVLGVWLHAIGREGKIQIRRGLVALPQHQPRFPKTVQHRIQELLARFHQGQPPTVQQCVDLLGRDVYQTLVTLGRLIPLNEKYVLDRETYARWMRLVYQALSTHPQGLTVAQIRDLLGVSRRWTVAFLEHLDEIGYTQRTGDVRVWRGQPPHLDPNQQDQARGLSP